jgi:hypothetical protein
MPVNSKAHVRRMCCVPALGTDKGRALILTWPLLGQGVQCRTTVVFILGSGRVWGKNEQ